MQLAASIANALRLGGEALTLRQHAAGTFVISTQTYTPGAVTNTSTYGLVKLIQTGLDGITVKRGDMEVWLPKLPLDAVTITPAIQDYLLRGSTVLVLLEIEVQPVSGYYRARARTAQ